MESVSERFLRYVAFDTQSDEFSETCPSTAKQKLLGAAIVAEMKAMGIADAVMDENGYVYGTVPGASDLPVIGLIAHMDTCPDASGADIKARVAAYAGGDILLNPEKDIWMREADYASLKRNVGKHLIVTDGTTLLGADDKAGVAEIMTAAQILLNGDRKHATLKIGFTPDEEIGRGADRFDIRGFGADYAYTVDGGTLGELEYENFNAASGCVVFHGLKEKGYGIYLLSNAGVSLREYFPGIPGAEYFDGLLVSAEEKLLKPQHEIYHRLYGRFGLDPARCFFIDDSPANIEAALCTGMEGTVFRGDPARLRRELEQAGIL